MCAARDRDLDALQAQKDELRRQLRMIDKKTTMLNRVLDQKIARRTQALQAEISDGQALAAGRGGGRGSRRRQGAGSRRGRGQQQEERQQQLRDSRRGGGRGGGAGAGSDSGTDILASSKRITAAERGDTVALIVRPAVLPENSASMRTRQRALLRDVGDSKVQERAQELEAEAREKRRAEMRAKKRTWESDPPSPPRNLPRVKVPECQFPSRYERGELPCTLEHGISSNTLTWVCPLENLDYEYYLPIFFDGLRCIEMPLSFFARQGVEDLLEAARGRPELVIPVVPKLVKPVRNALVEYNAEILIAILRALRLLVTCNDGVGEHLVPYYKQFLAPMNLFLDRTKNTGDKIDYGQRRHDDVGEEVLMTLEIMERTGGPNAFVNIKWMIPTYESCV